MAGFRDLQRLYLDDAAKKVHVQVGEIKAGDPVISWRNLPGVTGSVAILAVRKALQKKLVQGLVARLAGTLGSKLIVTLEGPLGWIAAGALAGHDVYSISQEVNNLPDRLKIDVYQGMKREFLDNAPSTIWAEGEGLKHHVELQLDTLHQIVAGGLDSLFKEFRSCAAYQEFTAGLAEKDQGDLALRLYLLRGTGTAAVGICDLAERLGPALVRVGPRQVNCIDRGLKSVGIGVLGAWFRLAPQRICDLVRIPPERLLALAPDAKNLARLTWVWDLPEPMQPVALTLQIDAKDYADWITSNLDRGRQMSLLSGNTADQVKKEVDRVKAAATSKQEARDGPSWFGSSASWALNKVPGLSAFRGIGDTLSAVLMAVGALFVAILSGKLGLFRFIGWLARGAPRK